MTTVEPPSQDGKTVENPDPTATTLNPEIVLPEENQAKANENTSLEEKENSNDIAVNSRNNLPEQKLPLGQEREMSQVQKSGLLSETREIVAFSSEEKMIWASWLNYFNSICVNENKDDLWKIRNIQKYLRGKALTLYINNCLNVLHWDELVELFNEEFTDPGQLSLTDFTDLKFGRGDNVNQYYQQKLKLGRSLGLDNRFILEGLTEGLPIQLKSLVVANAPKTTTEWRDLLVKLNKLQPSMSQESKKENVSHPPQFFRQWRPQKPNEYSLNPQARPFNYRVPFQAPQQRSHTPYQDRNNFRNPRPYVNQQRPPNAHYQGPLPPYPCKICLKYNITNAYHWMSTCPFRNSPMHSEISTSRIQTPPLQNVNYEDTRTPVDRQTPENSELGNSSNYGHLIVPGYFKENQMAIKNIKYQKCQIANVDNTEKSMDCLLDTGSSLSIIPENLVKTYNLKTVEVKNAINAQQTSGMLKIKRKCYVHLRIGNISSNVEFYVVDGNLPYVLLGLSECHKFKLNINCNEWTVKQNNQSILLVDQCKSDKFETFHLFENNVSDKHHYNQSGVSIEKCEAIRQDNILATEEVQTPQSANNKLPALLARYDQIFAKSKYDVGKIRMEPQRIHLTSDLPISLRAYRTSPKEEIEIKEQIQNLLQAGLIKESCSPYSAPVTLVLKREEGKKTRLCVDFRKLNAITKTDAEPLPRIDTLLDKLSKAKFFSTLDLASGYWHIPIHPRDTEKVAFATTFGLFEWLVLPFGLRNGPAIFNRVIRRILNKHKIDFACHYFDDIIIFSQTEDEHFQHLQKFFDICVQENLKLKLSKCTLVKPKINFLGYEVSNGCITPDNPNIEAIKQLKPPTNVKELQRILGSINVYGRFIPEYAKTRAPLNNLLRKNVPYVWDQNCELSFQKLKNALIQKPILKLYDPKVPCHLFVDASSHGVGCVLKQEGEKGVLHPVAYHSRNLRDYEKNYAITELECLAIVDALDKFYHYLHGQKFVIHTDHAALTWLKNVKNLRGRLFRWSLKLSMFDYEIKYQKGSTNVEADMLSRSPVLENISPHVHLLDLNEIKDVQHKENVIVNGKKFIEVNDVIVIKKKGLYKIVVPMSLRLPLIEKTHNQFGHPGIYKMINLITPQYYWPHINKDIENYVKHCHTCQLNKKCKQKRFGSLQEVPPTDTPFECLSLDTVGGFNYYNSTKKYLHLVTDHATRYVWGFPSKSVTTETYTNFLKQIFQIQVPQKLLTDRNAAFTASRFKKFLRNYNVKHLMTSSHHPETNGKIERLNQTIVTRLKCKVNSSSTQIPWTKLLDEVLNQYNLTPHSVTTFAPSYLLLGKLPYDPLLPNNSYYPPVDEARKIAKEKTIEYHHKNKILYDARFLPVKFKVGDDVIYEEFHYPNTRKLTSPYSGPYKILKQLSDVNFEIDKPSPHFKRNSEIVHSSKLRYYNHPQNFKLHHE